MTRLSKPALKNKMRAHEETIKKLETEFLSNEINENKDLWLEKIFEDAEPIYMEITSRYSKPLEVTIRSKIGSEQRWSKELSFPFSSSSSQV